jgi:hypothetical protein
MYNSSEMLILVVCFPCLHHKRLKESSQQLREPTAATNAELLEQIHKQDEELASLRERLNGQV